MRTVAIVCGVLTIIAILLGLAVWLVVLPKWKVYQSQSAAHAIAIQVGGLHRRNPNTTQADYEQLILELLHASVINIQVDKNGRPTDQFGTHFRIVVSVLSGASRSITVTSAGPDCFFGTSDDIQGVSVEALN